MPTSDSARAASPATASVLDAAWRRSISTWYPELDKPEWTPPSWVFDPAWTVLYAQMAYSARLVARSSDPERQRALTFWWLQLVLNAAWTPVFFGARRTGAGAMIIGALVPAVAATAVASAKIDRRAGLLYAPYLAWSTYAAALNFAIWRRNRNRPSADETARSATVD